MPSPKKVVLLACGSFNPVTNMHLRMFEVARDNLTSSSMEVVCGLVSPVSDGYGKAGLAPANHRCRMLSLALASSSWVRLDTWECEQESWTQTRRVLDHHRQRIAIEGLPTQSGPKRRRRRQSNDNLNEAALNVQVMLLCGADLLQSFSVPGLWSEQDIENIVTQYGLVVMTRSGYDVPRIIYENDILYRLRRHIHVVTEWIPNEISSTAVRRALMRGESVKYLLQDSVIDYIRQHGLYAQSIMDDINSNHTETEDGQETAV
ncbi:nicotinamide/nicotinic acid mononucleotide adenylyltransferase 1 [Dermacentor andersoni]|uniref:nicotinamide/nicotinic acid mononucleotide adenylyltransferase 1 n=1 Tax=Dermacentor andersoni TaxID=34620 RepID=UPI002155DFD7|nr:nicotinamide/nicotinic acid mononucleotide adenylyltransferase 1-like [Dermacentor andersoni]